MNAKAPKVDHDPDTIVVHHNLTDPNFELYKQELADQASDTEATPAK